ncbi:Signal transduction histidine kinase [Sporobacter termitidis DSM 10068]|uniref:histidine kinase n=1 Tax=Sporobacter termitidis DSM 10068 TaxID=1123282 RepID=A0A1M5U3P9_9FIRM|nr:HAMP domain-containing sensor histidine kinase [Sporobacter termitidis]SHH57657.1 Signal transduction histidine kinase [Sporobacter termitidis DSM 10068]
MKREEHIHPGKAGVIFGFAVCFAIFTGFVALAYIIVRHAGLSEFATAMLSGLGGLIFFCVFAALLSFIRLQHFKRTHRDFTHDIVLNAFEQISHGNFDIFIEPNPNDPYSEITDAFNEMAKNLGSLETMRQDFISNVSHEIQSPLTSIKGFAALLKNDDLPPDERRRYAKIIEAESRRLSSLSDNLLKLSALDGEKKPLNLVEYRLDKQLSQIILSLEPQWSAKNISFDVDLPKQTITADEDLLSQVWVNLLHNAIKFTPAGGEISVKLSDSAVIISDSGIGIAHSDLIHIFERFFKADKARDRALGGNGLGLSLVKKIVELHGFHITVESEINKGTQFTIRLN